MLTATVGNYVTRRAYSLGPTAATWGIVLLCLVPAGAYYAWAITLGFPSFFEHHPRGFTFNSMLLHLLNGTFDVDPRAIGDEGIVRDGRVYTYFGVLPALLRAPLLLFPGFPYTDYTRLSCTVAVSVMAAFKLAAVLTVWRAVGRPERSDLPNLFAVAILFGGAEIQFLRAIIFQEVLLWSAALAAGFVYLVVRGYYSARGFTVGLLAGLATVAGLCLLTRVSTALGLYVALGLLMLVLFWRAWRGGDRGFAGALAPFVPAAAILAFFILVTGVINYGRWGNPLVFTDPQNYLWWLAHARERLVRNDQYGMFSLVRLGYGLIYYFLPVWALPSGDGNLMWPAFKERAMDNVELPPGSFFVSDPLIIGLTVFALVQLVRSRPTLDRAVALPVLAGLFVPIALILTYSAVAFRYRLEFYPFLDLCALLGFGVLASRPEKPPLRLFAVAAIAGVVTAHALGLLYMLTPLGDASELLAGGSVLDFYSAEFR